MFIKQLSIFLENREGRLEEVLQALKEKDVNIISLSLADTSEYGLLRLLVSDPELGRDALRSKGFSAMLTDVLAVRITNRSGSLQELLQIIGQSTVNIEYMYALSTDKDAASIVIKTSDLQKAADLLKAKGVQIVTSQEVLSM